jgi:hypothetical protein
MLPCHDQESPTAKIVERFRISIRFSNKLSSKDKEISSSSHISNSMTFGPTIHLSRFTITLG